MRAIVRVAASIVSAITLLASANGVASADPLAGKTYKQALEVVSGWGLKPVIGTVMGSVLAIDDCTVSTWRKAKRTVEGRPQQQTILMNLNCNAKWATAGSPGASVADPKLMAAKAAAEKAEKTAEWCAEPKQATYAPCDDFWGAHEDLRAAAVEAARAKELKAWKTAKWCALPEQAEYKPCADFWAAHEDLRAAALKEAQS